MRTDGEGYGGATTRPADPAAVGVARRNGCGPGAHRSHRIARLL